MAKITRKGTVKRGTRKTSRKPVIGVEDEELNEIADERPARRGTRRGKQKEEKPKKKSKAGLIFGLVILLAGGGVGGFFIYKEMKKPKGYQESITEKADREKLNERTTDALVNGLKAANIKTEAIHFISKYPKNEFVAEAEQILADADEAYIRSKRFKDYELFKRRAELAKRKIEERRKLDAEKKRHDEEVARKLAEQKRLEAEKQERIRKERDDRLTENMTPKRWEYLNDKMRTMNYAAAKQLFQEYYTESHEKNKHHHVWGKAYQNNIDKAFKAFSLVSNSGKLHRGKKMKYEGKVGEISNISITEIRIRVEGVKREGNEFKKVIEMKVRPISNLTPEEFWGLLGEKISSDDTNKKNFVHYLFSIKEFERARKVIDRLSEEEQGFLMKEMKVLEPVHNRREITKALAYIDGLIDKSKKLDARKRVKRLKERWSHVPEYKDFEDRVKTIEGKIF